jgi:CheY-like chemotaxis protein
MKHTILIVEDTEDTRFFMKFLLEWHGYRVIEAVNGWEAVELTKQKHPELILMDIAMPFMDGLTAIRKIRTLDADGDVPIIAMTAHGHEYHELALEAGCNEMIGKPVDFQTLEPILSQYLPA